MTIRDFAVWSNEHELVEASALDELGEHRVAIDAADYLNVRVLGYHAYYGPAQEPLLPAIGGLPLIMKERVATDIKHWKDHNIVPLFVFSGLRFRDMDDPFRHKAKQAQINAKAWDLYDHHHADQAVSTFGESSHVTPAELFPALQAILHEHQVEFLVAPYSAHAQLGYFANFCGDRISAVAGPPELLLFGCSQVITAWDFEKGEFQHVRREKCISDMKRHTNNGDITEDMFVDACMLAGNDYLPILPQLENNPRKTARPLSAIDLILSTGPGRSAHQVCERYQNERKNQEMNYLDKFRRARIALRTYQVSKKGGKVEPLDPTSVPNDMHEISGARLPDELYFYLQKGIIGSRPLNWRTTGEIVEVQPLDGGASEDYKKLVSSKLTPLRVSVIALLCQPIHRFFQHNDLTLKCWFPESSSSSKHYSSVISTKDLPDVKAAVSKWNVKEDVIRDAITSNPKCGLIGSAILSLKDPEFVTKTLAEKRPQQPLKTHNEIIYNAMWRFFTLREYVDISHNLTPWGKVLAEAITALKGKKELEEPVIIAIELLRLGVLNSENMFPYAGYPLRGNDTEKQYNILVSRIACLGTLRHKPIGFTGPLSQHLLGYHSMITAVRNSLRDLAEVSMTHMLLVSDADKEFPNLTALGMSLPFLLHNDCALGIAVKSYLDELITHTEPTSDDAKQAVIDTASKRYFPQCVDFQADLEVAFRLWDAVCTGVRTASVDMVKEKKHWDTVDKWLASRR